METSSISNADSSSSIIQMNGKAIDKKEITYDAILIELNFRINMNRNEAGKGSQESAKFLEDQMVSLVNEIMAENFDIGKLLPLLIKVREAAKSIPGMSTFICRMIFNICSRLEKSPMDQASKYDAYKTLVKCANTLPDQFIVKYWDPNSVSYDGINSINSLGFGFVYRQEVLEGIRDSIERSGLGRKSTRQIFIEAAREKPGK